MREGTRKVGYIDQCMSRVSGSRTAPGECEGNISEMHDLETGRMRRCVEENGKG